MIKYAVMKLVSSYDVIGELQEGKDWAYKLKNPLLLLTTMMDNGVTVVYFRKYNQMAQDDNVDIAKDQVISTYVPNEDLVNYYKTMVKYHNIIENETIENMKQAREVIESVIDKPSGKRKKSSQQDEFTKLMDSLNSITSPNTKSTKH